jgi:hypothetical protein
VHLRPHQCVRSAPGAPSIPTHPRLLRFVAVLRAQLQAMAPAAAKVEAIDERDLPGGEHVVLSTRLIAGFQTVALARRMVDRRGRTRSAAASGVAGV